jgi:hypothetical protein
MPTLTNCHASTRGLHVKCWSRTNISQILNSLIYY